MQPKEEIVFIITNAGRNAMINAQQDGTQRLRLVSVGLGKGSYEPTLEQTELQQPFKTVPVSKVFVPPEAVEQGGMITVSALDSSEEAFAVFEVGIYAQVMPNGVEPLAEPDPSELILFAVYSNTSGKPCLAKTASSAVLITFDFILDNTEAGVVLPAGEIPSLPLATETFHGVVRLATKAETGLGITGQAVITPAALMGALKDSGTDLHKQIEFIAGNAEGAGNIKAVYSESAPRPEEMKEGVLYMYPSQFDRPVFDTPDSVVNSFEFADQLPTDGGIPGHAYLIKKEAPSLK